MKVSALARRAAAKTSSSLASGRPYAMLSRMVPENSEASWKTTPIRARSWSSGRSALGRPTTSMLPRRGS